ncbi:bifunctional PIG-L family deacetylase/class I SAM-dependent methyltransferase [Actinoalloteichus caeruleus]|uniref:bifunctional PIG-L family deacetylase/class I SAM-dependent methyltransferase n=1 Tax=Actinoalloteichus cyanogriseus TaxID=2893586 RepID=UPI0004131650|nr:bifunctional PIG-L family deacetylase/class I SAM-dependent methyltransferase [Actinoalloteichus caeruleus]
MTGDHTVEACWRPALAGVPRRRLPAPRRATVVAAHPDDETLGAGGVVRHLHRQGTEVVLVVATDGEAAFPDSPADERAELAGIRRRELRAALDRMGLDGVDPVWLGLPDSGLAEHEDALVSVLRELMADSDLCLFPWPDDPHPDHRAAGRAAAAAAPVGAHRWSYPIWLWHWRAPEDRSIPWDRALLHPLSSDDRAARGAAIAEFTSQLKPGPRGEDPILDEDMLSHLDRDGEVLFREPRGNTAPQGRFVELYERRADPWDGNGWYERRRRAVLLSALPRERYGHAVEPACGPGHLTRALAGRCDRVDAFDAVPAAVRAARRATSDLPGVRVRDGRLPAGLPAGPVDLVVLSEILYYLDDQDLTATLDGAVTVLRPGGHLLAAHWLPWAPEAPRSGWDAHRRLVSRPELRCLVAHEDEEFVTHVLERR